MNLFVPESLPTELRETLTSRTFAAEQSLFQQGKSADAFFVMETGRVKLVRATPERRIVTLHIARAGESFAESALFADTYTYGAIAELPSKVTVYPKQAVLSVLHHHPKLAEDYITALVKNNHSLMIQLELRDIRSAHTRVLHYLRHLVRKSNSKVICFDRPFKNIAADLGFTPETLSRALTKLEKQGAITRTQNSITLSNSSVA
jgi:CRP/FNR family transcriptional regulator, dissimilatory nitrate respiration regulator